MHKMLPDVVNMCTKEERSLFFILTGFLFCSVLEGSAFFPLGKEIPSYGVSSQ